MDQKPTHTPALAREQRQREGRQVLHVRAQSRTLRAREAGRILAPRLGQIPSHMLWVLPRPPPN
eukprot:11238686-Alexandrium_andersonii.AAC.1